MSILKSMYSAASGLGAHGAAVDVVSDNIANLNTVGFKAGRGRFEDILGATVAQSRVAGSSGLGTKLAGVDQMFTQGALLGTGLATDMAIQGDGFFLVRGNFDGINGDFYTRAGQFHLDPTGVLTNAQGLALQGYLADAQGNIGTGITDLVLPANNAVQPQATTRVDIAANIDSGAPIVGAFDVLDPATTSNFSTSVTVYDSLGGSHNVDVFFRRTGVGAWEWHGLVDGGELTGGTAGVPTEIANGNLTFNTNGQLDTETVNASSADFLGATPGQSITFDFGDSITTDGGGGISGVTSYAVQSSVSSVVQDGFTSGALAGITIADDGSISGTFTNGQRRVLGQVALTRFRNNGGLVRAGAGLFVASDQDSGSPLIGAAGTGGRGSIVSEALESSNVDLAQEFVNLINFQRGFQANSRTVHTADEMLTEMVNLKR